MGKRVSTRLIRKHRHYQYDEAADALGVAVQTLRSWRKAGLVVMADKRPHLILGEDLTAFIKGRQKSAQSMAADQLWCLTCKRPTRALDRVAFYTPSTATRGQLECVCEACKRPCFRFVGERSLAGLAQFFEIVRNCPSQG